MKKLPIGIQDFKDIVENNYVYVDKTKYIKRLSEGKYYFISRPRRFGKSLTISTLYYLFKGEKELFKDLYIYDKWEWKEYPVIKLSMSQLDITDEGTMRETLNHQLINIYKEYGITPESNNTKMLFSDLIQKLSKKEKTVVLIDEYDRPILNHITDGKAETMRNILREFYVVIKDADPYLRFAIITGITKLTKTGIFSSLNNLRDITTNTEYSEMMGITQEELENNFKENIKDTEKETGEKREDLLEKIKDHYDGFSFDGRKYVYNPYSILNYFQDKEFRNYWIESGTPKYLTEYIKSHNVEPETIRGKYITETNLTTYEIEDAPPVIYLLQSGYLTFKGKHDYLGYLVDYPNLEVKESMSELILSGTYKTETNELRTNIIIALEKKDIKKVIEEIQGIFSKIPYNLFQEKESWYHSIILTILWSCGLNAKGEVIGNLGKSDIELQYRKDMYIIEIKKASPDKSIKQIKEKGYVGKYKKPVTAIGIEIDTEERNITNYKTEII